MKLNNKNILITGATGLVGSWLVERLIDANTLLGIALDPSQDFLLESKNIMDKFDLIYTDIASYSDLKKIFKNNSFDLVIHLAAQTQVGYAEISPIRTFESNIQGYWNILELCRVNNTPLLNASSDKAYGSTQKLPYTELHELNAIYPYEISKAIADKLTQSYIKTYNANVTTLRCGNIYGGGDLNWERLIPGVIKSLIMKDQPVLRSDGTFTRDWVYVEDVAEAYEKIAFHMMEDNKKIFPFYNFSSPDYFSVIEIYKLLCNLVTGDFVEPKYEINSEYEIQDQKLDARKIKNDLGIEASVSISEGLSKTFIWYKENVQYYG